MGEHSRDVDDVSFTRKGRASNAIFGCHTPLALPPRPSADQHQCLLRPRAPERARKAVAAGRHVDTNKNSPLANARGYGVLASFQCFCRASGGQAGPMAGGQCMPWCAWLRYLLSVVLVEAGLGEWVARRVSRRQAKDARTTMAR